MAPSNKTLEAKLHAAVKDIFAQDQKSGENTLSVKAVRSKVTKDLGLEDNFFVTPEWKTKSKTLITEWGQELMDRDEEEETPIVETTPKKKIAVPAKKSDLPIKKGTKRGAPEQKAQPKKRQRKDVVSSSSEDEPSENSDVPSDDSAESSEFGEDTKSDAPRSKKSKKSAPTKRGSKNSKVVESEESEDDEPSQSSLGESDEASTPPKNKKAPPPRNDKHNKSKATVQLEEDSEDEAKSSPPNNTNKKLKTKVESSDSENAEANPKGATPKKATPKKHNLDEAEIKANDSDSSDTSILLDEAPKSKQRRKSKSDVASSKTSNSKSKTAKEPKVVKDVSPDEAQIKTLQSQLVKCGLRKIWAFELKQYGEDSKAKIRHLKDMLRDIGMVGRYSDARAREIKELRELQADLEAVKEGDSKWGLESKGRRARGAQRKIVDESAEEDEDSGDDEKEKPEEKAAKLRNELAFLGDESESD